METQTATKSEGLPGWAKGAMVIGGLYLIYKVSSSYSEQKKLDLSKNPGFFPVTWTNALKSGTPQNKFLTSAVSETLAKQLHNAIGTFTDDESEILNVFRNINSTVKLSQVSWMYNELYKQDLYTTLYQNLSDSELSLISDIIKKYIYS